MNLAIEDWLTRFMVIAGFYIPNTWAAFQKDQHKWEAVGRNALNFVATLGVAIITKSPVFGLTPLIFERFMKPKVDGPGWGQYMAKETAGKNAFSKAWRQLWGNTVERYLLNPLRPNYNPADIIKDLGASGKWETLDLNNKERFRLRFRELAAEGLGDDAVDVIVKERKLFQNEGKLLLKAIQEKLADAATSEKARKALESAAPKIEAGMRLLNRINLFDLTRVGIITTATMFLIGGLVMDLVFTFVAPFDHDFDASKYKTKPYLKKIQQLLFRHVKDNTKLGDNNSALAQSASGLSSHPTPAIPYSQLLRMQGVAFAQPPRAQNGWGGNA